MKTYFYSDGDQQFGPFTLDELQSKSLQADFLVWTEGMSEWKKISEIEELAVLVNKSTPPPLPPKTNQETSNTLQGFSPEYQQAKPEKKHKSNAVRNTFIILFVLAIVAIGIGYLYFETDYLDNIIDNKSGNTEKTVEDKKNVKIVQYTEIGEAREIRSRSAEISGKIIHNDNDLLDLKFEYSDGGATKTIRAEKVGDLLKANISNLYPNTTYTFCIVESSNNGENRSKLNSFTTLPLPPSINASVTHHDGRLKSFFSFSNLFGDKRRLVEACNFKNTNVRSTALNVAGQTEGSFNLGQICDIFDYCYNNWNYVNDPKKSEVYEYASNTISNGLYGDCDDFAVLMCSMLLAIGGDARINFAYNDAGGHAFTEINVGRANMQDLTNYIARRYSEKFAGSIYYMTDRYGNNWLNLDWQAKHPGGNYYKANSGTRFYILDDYCEDF